MKFPTAKIATLHRLQALLKRASQTSGVLSIFALGYLSGLGALNAQSPAPAPAVAHQPAPPADDRPQTVISSDELDMVGGDEANHFYFRGNVKVQATNMIATCDELEVISARQQGKGEGNAAKAAQQGESAETRTKHEAAAPNIGSIREIIMRGNVVISQEGRRATAGIAHLYPQEGRVVLAENPLVTDAQGTLSGWRMELYRGERKVRILSNPDEKQRTRVTLPALQDLGYGEPDAPASGSGDTQKGEDGQAQTTGETSATDKPATPPGADKAATTDATVQNKDATKTDDKDEPVPSRRSGGWNPVNRR